MAATSFELTVGSGAPEFPCGANNVAARLADLLVERFDSLLDLWGNLGEAGPTLDSPDAGDGATARERFLRPLGRVLIGALRDSADHRAVYLDERLRYADAELSPEERAAALARLLAAEASAFCALVDDQLEPDSVIEVLSALHAPLTTITQAAARVLFVGDCLFVETRAFLLERARIRGTALDVHHVFFSSGQAIADVDSAITQAIESYRPDLIGISLFSFQGVPPYVAAWRDAARPLGGDRAVGYVQGLVGLLESAIGEIRAVTNAPVIVHSPGGVPLDPLRRRVTFAPSHSRGQRRLIRSLNQHIAELVDHTENAILLDEARLLRDVGGPRGAAGPAFAPEDVPAGYFHTTRVGSCIAREYASIIDDYVLLGRAKGLFVDFDNTLWRGVMADGPVDHYVDRQSLLRELRQAGVLLIALSKNDHSAIRWDEVLLDPDDFVLLKLNWMPKPENVSSAITELDLAPGAFVLVDDNPAECALVSEQVPGVRMLDPDDALSWQALRRWLAFPSTTQTEEASRRTKMYREATVRRSALAGSQHDYPTMMRSLRLRSEVRPADKRDTARLRELIQRTNQFNTTTRRRSTGEIEALLTDEQYGIYVGTLRDRFGDLGVVATAIFDRSLRAFDSVVMSCRAMGFGVEFALLRAVLDGEATGPASGVFIPSDRNGPAADLFLQAGFQREARAGDERQEWILPPDAAGPNWPEWLERIE